MNTFQLNLLLANKHCSTANILENSRKLQTFSVKLVFWSWRR